jgi:Galactose-1-phosphate uridylyltransferase
MAYRLPPVEPNGPNWTVRVVPNKFPALQVEGDIDRQGLGLYDRMNGIGAHEVIIETPNHTDSLADMPTKRIEDVLWAYRDRMIDLKKDVRFRYILIFKNHGASAAPHWSTATHNSLPCRSSPPASWGDRGLPGSL